MWSSCLIVKYIMSCLFREKKMTIASLKAVSLLGFFFFFPGQEVDSILKEEVSFQISWSGGLGVWELLLPQ